MTDVSFSSLLAHALTGENLPLADFTTVEAFLSDLEQHGWPSATIREHAEHQREAERPWPHAVAPDQLAELGPAQWYARLTQVRTALGLDVVTLAPSRRTVLNSDERRLLAEAPPHYGHAG